MIRTVHSHRPLSCIGLLLMLSCGGESPPAVGGASGDIEAPITSADAPQPAAPDSGLMDVEPDLAAVDQEGSEATDRTATGQGAEAPRRVATATGRRAAEGAESTGGPATTSGSASTGETEPQALSDDGAQSPVAEGSPAGGAGTSEKDDPGGSDDPSGSDDAEPPDVVQFPAPSATTSDGRPVARLVLPDEPLVFARPEAVRGIYLNGWASGSRRRTGNAIALAKRTEINSLVIDLKDATGYVSHPTQVMLAREVGADQVVRIRDLVGLMERLHEADIYPIARIVIVKDPLLAASRPDLAVQDTAGGVWVDSKGLVWSNMYDREVWDYHIALAKEAIAVGFPEIQWDYLRFPDASEEDLNRAWYPGQGPRRRTEAVREFLEYAREELGDVAMTADVFGITTSATTDVGIGQLWEEFIGAMDVALPMVYPSHYGVGSFGIQDPNGHPYEIVKLALGDAMRRSANVEGAGSTRPWLQDFTLGAPAYGAPEVRAQIQATYDAGIDEWILWNPSSRYSEAALEPAGGYPEGMEPTIRVGGQIVPVSQREAAMEAERIGEAATDAASETDAAADSVPGVIVADTAQIGR